MRQKANVKVFVKFKNTSIISPGFAQKKKKKKKKKKKSGKVISYTIYLRILQSFNLIG